MSQQISIHTISTASSLSTNTSKQSKEECCDNIIDIAVRSIGLMEHELSNYELDGIDELITIETKKVGLLETSKGKYLYQKGYQITKKYIDAKMK